MRRHTTNTPSTPHTSAMPAPESAARTMKSSTAPLHDVAVHGVAMIVMVGIRRHAALDFGPEQGQELAVAADRVGMAGAAYVAVEAHHLVGGCHHQVQVVRDHHHRAAAPLADPGDEL